MHKLCLPSVPTSDLVSFKPPAALASPFLLSVLNAMHSRNPWDFTPSHPHDAGAKHVGFSPTR